MLRVYNRRWQLPVALPILAPVSLATANGPAARVGSQIIEMLWLHPPVVSADGLAHAYEVGCAWARDVPRCFSALSPTGLALTSIP